VLFKGLLAALVIPPNRSVDQPQGLRFFGLFYFHARTNKLGIGEYLFFRSTQDVGDPSKPYRELKAAEPSVLASLNKKRDQASLSLFLFSIRLLAAFNQ